MSHTADRNPDPKQCPEGADCYGCTAPARETCGFDDHLAAGALVEMEIERRASLAFHFPVSHGPRAEILSAEWEAEESGR